MWPESEWRGKPRFVNLQDVGYRTLSQPSVRYAQPFGLVLVLRRLEDRIRELCAKALIARGPELHLILEELKSALHEHSERLRQVAVLKLVSGGSGSPEERHTMYHRKIKTGHYRMSMPTAD